LLVDHAGRPEALLVLGHGAGGGPDAPDLALLARRLPELGVTVVRVEQPWRLSGRRIAVAPPLLDEAWLEIVPLLVEPWPDLPLIAGGRSAGARVACRTAGALGVQAVVCLAFPLHPPGRPDRSRAAELLAPQVPRLVLQGSRDSFGGADDVRRAVAGRPDVRVVELSGADHSFRLAKGSTTTPADQREQVVAEVARFVRRE
jgi:predicted alpha/beta-hydrolase family hydrolase